VDDLRFAEVQSGNDGHVAVELHELFLRGSHRLLLSVVEFLLEIYKRSSRLTIPIRYEPLEVCCRFIAYRTGSSALKHHLPANDGIQHLR
jgi:hypothetical protein